VVETVKCRPAICPILADDEVGSEEVKIIEIKEEDGNVEIWQQRKAHKFV